jgi:KUP system potassium uptake protein
MKSSKITSAATIGAMGVVYGDIGTSPLYAFEQTMQATGTAQQTAPMVLGILSLMFWSLLIVVTIKYIVLMLRADNDGEGGILALFALVQRRIEAARRWGSYIVGLAVLGAALFYCDALITPAISVLSAVEGLEVLSPSATRYVVPITLVLIVLLFSFQSRGTERVGRLFGPVMLLWFGVLAVTGVIAILQRPSVLKAVDPRYGLIMLMHHQGVALAVLGAVFLTLTGGEALYADMGHFGKGPVRAAWFTVVWPSLILNYFGQGALVLQDQSAAHKTLFAMLPAALLPGFVVLATAATIIASQATITGAFSMTRQAIQLDLLPRLRILQTSAHEHGQIYVPVVNAVVFVAVCILVISFGSSDALGNAYGAAVAGTMGITTVLAIVLAQSKVSWKPWLIATVFGPLLFIDVMYIISNLTKFAQGAWVPLLLAMILFSVFMTWRFGRRLLRAALRAMAVPLKKLPELTANAVRVPGTAVFLVSEPNFVPTALLRNLEYNHVLHERVIFLNMEFVRSPRQDPADRVRIDTLLPELYLVTARFGFMETPDVSEALRQCRAHNLKLFAQDCSFFLGWHLVAPRPRTGYEGLRLRSFAWMQRGSTQAAEFFSMPEHGVMVLATQVEL